MTSILTGLRTNSSYHLGNVIGALHPLIHIQESLKKEDNLYLFLPDLHSIESDNSFSNYRNSINNTKWFIASGIDPYRQNTYIYRQSQIPAHTQLAWLLNWFTYMGEASRMTQYKDKSSTRGESIPVSLLTYPILQAADILLYDAEYIPVGDDQKQHIELTRDLGIRFNNRYPNTFTLPKPWKEQIEFQSRDQGSRIMSLSDPSKKMSKSDSENAGTIWVNDTLETVHKKIMQAATDSVGMIEYDPEKRQGISNLLVMLSECTKTPLQDTISYWQGKEKYGELKHAVSDAVCTKLSTMQKKFETISDQDILDIWNKSEAALRNKTEQKIKQIYTALGLLD